MGAPGRAAPRVFELDLVPGAGPLEFGTRTGFDFGPGTLDRGTLHGHAVAFLFATPSVLRATPPFLLFEPL
jgi:hypothetical protein